MTAFKIKDRYYNSWIHPACPVHDDWVGKFWHQVHKEWSWRNHK